jgi:GNAT superfamily N-acetyltransferase
MVDDLVSDKKGPSTEGCKNSRMDVQEFGIDQRDAVISLWEQAGLTRPWNSPYNDYDRATRSESSAVLGVVEDGHVVATVMVGHDGHRGWVYYLAVASSKRKTGLGATMMSAAETWVRSNGMPKIQLMVRAENVDVRDFYLHRGYEASDVTVYGLRLET